MGRDPTQALTAAMAARGYRLVFDPSIRFDVLPSPNDLSLSIDPNKCVMGPYGAALPPLAGGLETDVTLVWNMDCGIGQVLGLTSEAISILNALKNKVRLSVRRPPPPAPP